MGDAEIFIITLGFIGIAFLSYLAGYISGRNSGFDYGFDEGIKYQKEIYSHLKGRMK